MEERLAVIEAITSRIEEALEKLEHKLETHLDEQDKRIALLEKAFWLYAGGITATLGIIKLVWK